MEYQTAIQDSELLNPKMNLLIEEYFEGHEIDIEILIQNDQVKFFAISDNFSPLEPTFYEQGEHILKLFELSQNLFL